MARATCLLVFPDDWIAYSPTVLNLLTLLKERGVETTVLTFESDFAVPALDRLDFVPLRRRLRSVLSRIGGYGAYRLRCLVDRIRRYPPFDHYIGVDSVGAYALQRAGVSRFDYLSLEVHRGGHFPEIQQDRIRSVVIQSDERYAYLFPNGGPQRHLIQNAPIMTAPAHARVLSARPRLVFLGNAIPLHGITECIDLVATMPELSLHICGPVGPDVAAYIDASPAASRVSVEQGYVSQDDVRALLSKFDVGLCLYNVASTDFNYQSVPSGKLFNYFSAGLPVIASDLLGLQSTRTYNAGVLISENTLVHLKTALQQVFARYGELSEGAANAANAYSFGRMADPYLQTFGPRPQVGATKS